MRGYNNCQLHTANCPLTTVNCRLPNADIQEFQKIGKSDGRQEFCLLQFLDKTKFAKF